MGTAEFLCIVNKKHSNPTCMCHIHIKSQIRKENTCLVLQPPSPPCPGLPPACQRHFHSQGEGFEPGAAPQPVVSGLLLEMCMPSQFHGHPRSVEQPYSSQERNERSQGSLICEAGESLFQLLWLEKTDELLGI